MVFKVVILWKKAFLIPKMLLHDAIYEDVIEKIHNSSCDSELTLSEQEIKAIVLLKNHPDVISI